MQVDVLTVVPEARLVVALHPEHVDAVGVQVLDEGAGAPHLLPPLPQLQPLGLGVGLAELHRVVPGGRRVLRQPPAQEDLVVGVGALRVDDGGLGRCGERQRRASGSILRPAGGEAAGRREGAFRDSGRTDGRTTSRV